MATTKKPKARSRYSIGEWYGVGLESLTSTERFRQAKIECEADAIIGKSCPFQTNAKCNNPSTWVRA